MFRALAGETQARNSADTEYNGTREVGIGSLKTRAEHEAAWNGRPGEWTGDDVEAARMQANELSRPRGHKPACRDATCRGAGRGSTPDQAWAGRARVTAEEHKAFKEAVAKYLAEELPERLTLFGGIFDPEGRVAAERVSVVPACAGPERSEGAAGRRALVVRLRSPQVALACLSILFLSG
jgi:hypothetical protein